MKPFRIHFRMLRGFYASSLIRPVTIVDRHFHFRMLRWCYATSLTGAWEGWSFEPICRQARLPVVQIWLIWNQLSCALSRGSHSRFSLIGNEERNLRWTRWHFHRMKTRKRWVALSRFLPKSHAYFCSWQSSGNRTKPDVLGQWAIERGHVESETPSSIWLRHASSSDASWLRAIVTCIKGSKLDYRFLLSQKLLLVQNVLYFWGCVAQYLSIGQRPIDLFFQDFSHFQQSIGDRTFSRFFSYESLLSWPSSANCARRASCTDA